MAINIERVRVYITDIGYLIGEVRSDCGNIISGITLYHPLKLIPIEDGSTSVGAIFTTKDEWFCIRQERIVGELPLTDGLIDLYKKYEQKVFGSIIMPDSSGLKL